MYFSRYVNKKLGEGMVKCQSVVRPINPASYYRIFYTSNRHWLLKTLQRIKDAGLDAKWDEQHIWKRLMWENNMAGRMAKGGLGLIDLSNFTPVFVIWVLVALLSATVLLLELYLINVLEELN